MRHGQEQPKVNTGAQLNIDFDAVAKFEARRAEVAHKYKVVDESSIYEDAQGVWRFVKGNESVEEWDRTMSLLDEKEQNDIYHRN